MKMLGILGGATRYKQIFTVYSVNGLSPTITTAASHGNGMPYILVKVKNERSVLHSNSRAAGKNNRTTEQQNNRTTEQQNNRLN